MVFILVHSLGGLINRHLFLIALEAGKSEFRCQHGWVQVRGPLPAWEMPAFLLCPQKVERGSCVSSSSYKSTDLIMEAPIS